MNLFAHICIALVYLGALVCYFRVPKRYALFFALSASVALVLSGLSLGFEAYIPCVALTIMDLVLLALVLFKNSNIKVFTLSISQIPLIVIWFYYFWR